MTALTTIISSLFLNFNVYRICKHLKRISSSPVEFLPLKKTDVNKTTRIISVGSCGACILQLRKQIKLFDTKAFQLVSGKFRSVQFLESNGPVKDASRKLSL